MKSVLMALTLLASVTASAAGVTDARFNQKTGKIEVDVNYSGCRQREFKLEIGVCYETYPVQCEAQLVETSDQRPQLCQAFFEHTVEISLEEAGLNDSYFTGASLLIKGDRNTQKTVRLPR